MIGRRDGLTPAWRRMLSPVRYLRISHAEKRSFDFWWPLGLAAVTLAIFVMLPKRPPILGSDGFLRGLHDLIGLLAAFFVAALAAVSTVERAALDAPMMGKAPELDSKPLSRRQFVCMLFGYLSVMAFALYLASIAAEIAAPSLRAALSPAWMGWVRAALGGIYAVAFWNMACTTLLGIWFLVERVPLKIEEDTSAKLIEGLAVAPSNWQRRRESEAVEQNAQH